MVKVRVRGAARLAEGTSKVFSFFQDDREREAFVLRQNDKLHAFLNECPHWAVELDLGDGHFYDEKLDRIYCKNHGALFLVDTGACETGPCLGRSLDSLSLSVDADDVLVEVPGEVALGSCVAPLRATDPASGDNE